MKKDNNEIRKILLLLLLWILFFLAIKWHVSLGLLPESDTKNISVSFDYYGAFEEQVETLVLKIEEACSQLRGIKNVSSVSEPGKGYIFCTFSDRTSLDNAYVQVSDATAHVYAGFPKGVNRPVITRNSPDSYPVFISFFPLEQKEKCDYIKKSYESVPGSGEVSVGGYEKKELYIQLHSNLLSGMRLSPEAVGSLLQSSNLVSKVTMPGGVALVLESQISDSASLKQIMVTPGCSLLDVADVEYKPARTENFGHIDGNPAMLFFVTKAGGSNSLKLCRHLRKITSDLGGDVLYDQGQEVESVVWLSAFCLFVWIAILLLFIGYKNVLELLFSVSGGVAALSASHLQLDATGFAALFVLLFLVAVSRGLRTKVCLALFLFIGLLFFIALFYTSQTVKNLSTPVLTVLFSGYGASIIFSFCFGGNKGYARKLAIWWVSPLLLFLPFLFIRASATSGISFSLEYDSGTPFGYIQKSASEIEAEFIKCINFDRIISHGEQGRASFTLIGGKKREIIEKISELSSRYPEIFFYIPEKHTKHAVDVIVYGNDVLEIEDNILKLARYVNENVNNVNIVYNFKSDNINIVLEIAIKCITFGLYPHDIYKTLYYTIADPVVDKCILPQGETDIKICGDSRYKESMDAVLSVPVPAEGGTVRAGDLVRTRKELYQSRIYHRNRMRCMSFSVTGTGRDKLQKLISSFPFTGSCYGEVL